MKTYLNQLGNKNELTRKRQQNIHTSSVSIQTRLAASLCVLMACFLYASTGFQTLADDWGLTKQERAQGWKLLFNGRDTTGWANLEKDTVSNWSTEDGALVLTEPGGEDLVYIKEQFEDFELSVDWKTEGNSGVFVRMSDQADWLNTSMEIQILPEHGTSSHSTGALYDLVAPPSQAKVRKKDWNNFLILCDGPIISCKLNGIETFRIDLRDNRWKTPQGKFKLAYATLPRKGWIMLQDHGKRVAFRNIRVRPLR